MPRSALPDVPVNSSGGEPRTGMACEHTVESLMLRADRHLYKTKQTGRSRGLAMKKYI
jgi:predicted signal transduction protein with EAL and GGDEF domain